MTDAPRKGWCPGALRPMMARDGLLVRLRLTGGHLDARTAHALAALSAYYGNGLFDLSARANLQMRGVAEGHLQPLLDALDDLHLLDRDPAGEAVRNVIGSPLAGLAGAFDIEPILRALEEAIVGDPALRALPGKFGFLIDDGGEPTLAGIPADVRFDLHHDGTATRAWIGLGGTRDHAVPFGTCAPEEIVEAALYIAKMFLALSAGGTPPARRMAHLVNRLGAAGMVRAFGGQANGPRLDYSGAFLDRPPVGPRRANDLSFLGLAVPFGRFDHAMLGLAADAADAHGAGFLRLTPWRCLLVPGVDPALDLAALRAGGFITDPADPRLRMAACVGVAGCERGTTATPEAAMDLLDLANRFSGSGIAIHVSGCAKGCAKSSRTPLTLVAHDGVYDLVHAGKASDVPNQRGLDLDAVRNVIVRLKGVA